MPSKTTISFFQTGGADETIEGAKAMFAEVNPETFILAARFVSAYPGDRDGRWVEIEITHA
jgi:hypothetical protein